MAEHTWAITCANCETAWLEFSAPWTETAMTERRHCGLWRHWPGGDS